MKVGIWQGRIDLSRYRCPECGMQTPPITPALVAGTASIHYKKHHAVLACGR